MEHKDNIDTKWIEQFANDFAKDFTNALAESEKTSEEADKCCLSAIRNATASAFIKEFERLVCKYEKAPFITRWYWKRRIKKLGLAIDELNKILSLP